MENLNFRTFASGKMRCGFGVSNRLVRLLQYVRIFKTFM